MLAWPLGAVVIDAGAPLRAGLATLPRRTYGSLRALHFGHCDSTVALYPRSRQGISMPRSSFFAPVAARAQSPCGICVGLPVLDIFGNPDATDPRFDLATHAQARTRGDVVAPSHPG